MKFWFINYILSVYTFSYDFLQYTSTYLILYCVGDQCANLKSVHSLHRRKPFGPHWSLSNAEACASTEWIQNKHSGYFPGLVAFSTALNAHLHREVLRQAVALNRMQGDESWAKTPAQIACMGLKLGRVLSAVNWCWFLWEENPSCGLFTFIFLCLPQNIPYTALVRSYDATLGLSGRPFSIMRVPSLVDMNHCASIRLWVVLVLFLYKFCSFSKELLGRNQVPYWRQTWNTQVNWIECNGLINYIQIKA